MLLLTKQIYQLEMATGRILKLNSGKPKDMA